MKKVIVIGCPGSGKTTFAEKLNKCTGMPLYHLDAIWHKPDRTHIPREEYDARVSKILSLDSWMIDGNYGRTIEGRIKASDTVFLFDLPSEVCIEGAISRIGKARYDLPWIESEPDPEFINQIERFSTDELPRIYDLLETHKEGKQIVVFKSRDDADKYIAMLQDKKMEQNQELYIELCDNEWKLCGITHDRQIARAIVFDDEGYFYFVGVDRDDDFGRATYIETAGGGVEDGEDLYIAIERELSEELGASVDVICKIGVVSDYYNLIHRHNINNYFLCKIRSFGQKHMTNDEIYSFHLSTIKLTYDEALCEYEKAKACKLGRLVCNREEPILRRAKEIIDKMDKM